MKIEKKEMPVEFKPVVLIITLESEAECKALRHLAGCWDAQGNCQVPGVKSLADRS